MTVTYVLHSYILHTDIIKKAPSELGQQDAPAGAVKSPHMCETPYHISTPRYIRFLCHDGRPHTIRITITGFTSMTIMHCSSAHARKGQRGAQ